MTMIRTPNLIEPALWHRAELVALAFATPPDSPPMLGLVFRDADLVSAIFNGWRHALGEVDQDDVVRVAIIEGEVSGRPPGYSVHLSMDRADAPAGTPGTGEVWRRMPPATVALRRFQEAYARHGRYLLAPATYVGRVGFLMHLAIGKRRLALRSVSDIGLIGDPDAGLWAP